MQAGAIDSVTRKTAAVLITGYQKYISPIKGFSCAHRVLHRSESCSQYVKRTIMEHGLGQGLPLIRQRFRDCKTANQVLRAQRTGNWLPMQDGDLGEDLPDIPEQGEPSDPEASETESSRRRGSFLPRRVAPSAANNREEGSIDSACDTAYCADMGCDSTDCASGCDLLDCNSMDCSSLDCSGLDCGDLSSCGDCGDIGSCGN